MNCPINYDDDWQVIPDVDQPVVVHVDKVTHDVLFENETEESVTVAIRPKQTHGAPDAQE